MAISEFWNFEFLTSKISKKLLFWKKVTCFSYKIQNFDNFQKTGIYVKELDIFNHHGKFQPDISIFGPPRLNLVLQHYAELWRHIQKQDFWEFYLTYIKTNGTIGFLSSFRIRNIKLFSKLKNFKIWPFLTWPWTWFRFFFDKIKLYGILTVIFEFYVEIGP